MGARRIASALAAVTLAIVVSGCTQTVSGAGRAGPSPPGGSPDLGAFLLDPGEVAEVVGADELSVIIATDQLSDNSFVVSDETCLGTLYQTEERVYADAGWTDVVHELLAEPAGTPNHLVEQSVVAFGYEELAQKFFDESVAAWSNCIGNVVHAEGGLVWQIRGVSIMGRVATQRYEEAGGSGGACDHTLSVTGRYAVEVSVCGMELRDDSVQLAGRVVDRIG